MSTAALRHPNLDPNPLPLRQLLASYTTSHPLRSPSPLPASSRVNPKVAQRVAPPTSSSPLLWSISDWVMFFKFATAKGIHVIWSLVKHFLVGPQRKSWGYRMTFITSVMRNVADHTSFADIVMIRRLISVHALVPLPVDAVVTPITFLVPKRTSADVARGFLRELDSLESGERELSGEWVVGTEVWKRLKAERRARHHALRRRRRVSADVKDAGVEEEKSALGNGRTSSRLGRDSPEIETDEDSLGSSKRGSTGERVIYYVHGGAYYVGNAATHRLITIGVSKACNARVFAITYRLAPEHAFPLPLHDVLAGYLRLLAPPLSIPPENIIIAGDSAGGGLSLALCMYLRDEGYQLPAGLVLMSPWVDLTMSCGSWEENADSDVVPRPEADDHLNPVGCYLGPKGISKYLTHPYASPLFGDLHNLPPMLIQSGDSEVLRDEVTLLAHKATLAGVNVTHELYEDMVHVFQMFTFLPAAQAAINSIGRWVRVTLPKIEEEAEEKLRQVGRLGTEVQEEVMDSSASRLVGADGQDILGLTGTGRSVAIPEEMEAVADMRARERQQRNRRELWLDLHLDENSPTTDMDSLHPAESGISTPTQEQASSPVHRSTATSPGAVSDTPSLASDPSGPSQYLATRPSIPRLRRALTSFTSPPSPASSPPSNQRRRRPTLGSASLHASPSIINNPSSIPIPKSNPVSPTPSIRRRLRGPSIGNLNLNMGIGGGAGGSGVDGGIMSKQVSTRGRSHSHSDILNLVEGYVEGGAANETVVYAPGGEVRSVCVLGEQLEDDVGEENIFG